MQAAGAGATRGPDKVNLSEPVASVNRKPMKQKDFLVM
jgi:hypothetical protein